LTPVEHLIHGLAGLGVVTQALTGFSHSLGFGELGGWKLLIHMSGAGMFTLGLVGVTLLWAGRCRFGSAAPTPRVPLNSAQKTLFWLGLLSGWLVMLPMLLAMLPLFGTVVQRQLIELHEAAALAFVAIMVLHTVASAATWWKRGTAS
jgi:hypothetical protein